MRIRTTLILIGLFGNVVLALSLIFLYGYRENIQRSYSSESLVSTYESAWFQTLETSFDAISAWLPKRVREKFLGSRNRNFSRGRIIISR